MSQKSFFANTPPRPLPAPQITILWPTLQAISGTGQSDHQQIWY